jgi:hypothetical protein
MFTTNPALRRLWGLAAFGLLTSALTLPALADGPNNSSPNAGPPPPTFSSVTTFPQLPASVVPGTCQQQYVDGDDTLWQLTVAFNALSNISAAAAAVLPYPGDVAAGVAAAGFGASATTADDTRRQFVYDVAQLPDCNATFIGSVEISNPSGFLNPGLKVEGNSIFESSVGIGADLNVNGNVNASTVTATQGISADGGTIFLGDTNLSTYSDGITLGGGALSGAGGPASAEAVTGDIDAIAIGNGASAMQANDTALGTGAAANGGGGTALGAGTSATTGTAVGNGAKTSNGISIGIGTGQPGDQGTAIGNGSRAVDLTDTAVGHNSLVLSANGTAYGANTSIGTGSDNGVVVGENSTIGNNSDNVTAIGRDIDIGDNIN